jgi:hypothetical protein
MNSLWEGSAMNAAALPDREWFQAHPPRLYRLRPVDRGDMAPGEAPPAAEPEGVAMDVPRHPHSPEAPAELVEHRHGRDDVEPHPTPDRLLAGFAGRPRPWPHLGSYSYRTV